MQSGSYGWRVRDSEGAVAARSAAGSYRSSVATIQAGVEQSQGTVLRGSAQIDGAFAAMGGGVFASNRIDDSFAVVDAGKPGVPVLYEPVAHWALVEYRDGSRHLEGVMRDPQWVDEPGGAEFPEARRGRYASLGYVQRVGE